MRRIIIAHRLRDLIHLPVRIPDQFNRFLNPVILKVFPIRKSHLIFKESRKITLVQIDMSGDIVQGNIIIIIILNISFCFLNDMIVFIRQSCDHRLHQMIQRFKSSLSRIDRLGAVSI